MSGTNISHTQGGAKNFYTQGGQTFFVGGGGSYDYDDEEIAVSEASKFSAGARNSSIYYFSGL